MNSRPAACHMRIFEALGMRVAKALSRFKGESQAFPQIATEQLEREHLYRIVDYRDILAWLTSTSGIPFQSNIDSTFGEPPLTLFWHPVFYIEALFWTSSTTAIHGHGFSGAFQVLEGTSVQSLFHFDASDKDGRCRVGRLQQRDVSLLRPGATQTIESGERFVHSVFHLGYPSVTIVIRSRGGDATQYKYYRPGIAVVEDVKFDQLTTRLLQVANLQATLQSNELAATASRIGRQCELAASFKLLQNLEPILLRQGRLGALGDVILALAPSHGHVTVSRLAEALTFERRLQALRRARETVVDDELRLFLALLLTQQERGFIVAQTAAYTSTADPVHTIVDWICELGSRKVLNVPADDETKRLMTLWLQQGKEAASHFGQQQRGADVVAERIRQLQAEPLLTPLLQDQPQTSTVS